MIKPWQKWSLGFTGVVVALGAVKAAGYPVEEARPALHYELSELAKEYRRGISELAGEYHADKLATLKKEWYDAKEKESNYKDNKKHVPDWLIEKLISLEASIKKLEKKKN